MTEPTNIDQLAYELESAKLAEEAANQARLRAESALISAIGLKDEGSQTVKASYYKVTTVQSWDRKLADDYEQKLDSLSPGLFSAIINYKPHLNVTELKRLATNNPDAYRLACSAIEAKPCKPAVKIERIIETQEAA